MSPVAPVCVSRAGSKLNTLTWLGHLLGAVFFRVGSRASLHQCGRDSIEFDHARVLVAHENSSHQMMSGGAFGCSVENDGHDDGCSVGPVLELPLQPRVLLR